MTGEIHGVTGAPYKTPQVRKKLPSPHQRDRIDMDGGTRVKRSWQDISVLKIQKDDIVSGVGRIAAVSEYLAVPDQQALAREDYEVTWTITVSNVMGDMFTFHGGQRVYAFTREPTDAG